MPPSRATLGATVWDLPPLILHPFNERVSPSALLDNSKAALMLSGLIPNDGSHVDDLNRRLLTGRYSEIRMLYYLGKDVFRWIEQCLECASRIAELRDSELRRQSFAELLVSSPPGNVREKLIGWGVADYASIFARGVGMNSLFSAPPACESLSEEFLRNYHRYADALYKCFRDSEPYDAATPGQFRFDLYASGEYSRMLESEWEAE